mmetsp:Transcript_978/g.2221  ORF Transcript_978/g.2221 Transcript_978/m.2221 type:complete len:328 (-) Transcript_978:195-1178(-)
MEGEKIQEYQDPALPDEVPSPERKFLAILPLWAEEEAVGASESGTSVRQHRAPRLSCASVRPAHSSSPRALEEKGIFRTNLETREWSRTYSYTSPSLAVASKSAVRLSPLKSRMFSWQCVGWATPPLPSPSPSPLLVSGSRSESFFFALVFPSRPSLTPSAAPPSSFEGFAAAVRSVLRLDVSSFASGEGGGLASAAAALGSSEPKAAPSGDRPTSPAVVGGAPGASSPAAAPLRLGVGSMLGVGAGVGAAAAPWFAGSPPWFWRDTAARASHFVSFSASCSFTAATTASSAPAASSKTFSRPCRLSRSAPFSALIMQRAGSKLTSA